MAADGDGAAAAAEMNYPMARSPFAPPGQRCDLVKGRSGPCDGTFKEFPQCDIPLITGKAYIKGTVTNAGDNIVFEPQTPKIYAAGVGDANGANGGNTVGVFGPLTMADTVEGENNAMGYGEGMIFSIFGLVIGLGPPIVGLDDGGENLVKVYGTEWLDDYEKSGKDLLLNEVSLLLKHGSTNGDIWLGSMVWWRVPNLQDNLPTAGQYVPFRCRDMSGAQADSDKVILHFQLENEVQIANRPGAPTVAGTEVYFPILAGAYGDPECRDKKGVCPQPDMQDVNSLQGQINELTKVVKALARAQGA